MKKTLNLFLICTDTIYYKNYIFQNDSPFNRDNYYYPNYLLKQELKKIGCEINTFDFFAPEKHNNKNTIFIFHDIPANIDFFIKNYPNIKKVLFIYEAEVVYPVNYDRDKYKYFDKIFSWNNDLITELNFARFYLPNKIPDDFEYDISKKEKLCALISGNKLNAASGAHYKDRIDIAKWFEKHHIEDLDVYGMGWKDGYVNPSLWFLTKAKITSRLLDALKKTPLLRKVVVSHFKNYKGEIQTKKDCLLKYKFSICYENASRYKGYITEKIFDSFFAGCIPIYWGAPNVTDYIPEDTFIDKRKFSDYKKLYNFIKNMPDSEYIKYLENIKSFLKSDKAYNFSAQKYVQTFKDEVVKWHKDNLQGS